MKKRVLSLFLASGFLLLAIFSTKSALSNEKKSDDYRIFEAKGWFGNGNKEDFKITLDSKIKFEGDNSILIEAKKSSVKEFATIIQKIDPEKYLNKRVKFSGYIKTENAGHGCLWMRIDGEDKKALQFDNMYDRAPQGTTDWKKYDVVLDVPNNSKYIVFGAFLDGKGKAWFDNFSLEVVDKNVELTDKENEIKKVPENLNFEK